MRTQYPDFDKKFEMAISRPVYSDLLEMNHVYGISSNAQPNVNFTLDGTAGVANKAEPPENPPAKNTFTYKP